MQYVKTTYILLNTWRTNSNVFPLSAKENIKIMSK